MLNGLASKTLLEKINDLEKEKAQIDAAMQSMKASVDASAIPERTLRHYADKLADGEIQDISVYLSIVYRVEVGKDTITIWTILDANPDGTYDFSEEGVLLTPGVAPAPPDSPKPKTFWAWASFYNKKSCKPPKKGLQRCFWHPRRDSNSLHSA